MFIGVTIADEDNLVTPTRDRRVRDHGLLNGIGEVGAAIEWTYTAGLLRVQRINQISERGDIIGWQIRDGIAGKCHYLDLDLATRGIEQRLSCSTYCIQHDVQLAIVDTAAEVEHEYHIDVLRLTDKHGSVVILGHRNIILHIDDE